MGSIPRVAKPKFTREELRLLQHHPTEKTWYCEHRSEQFFEGGTTVVVTDVCNAGTDLICWMCLALKPENPKLAWPIYQEALRKKELISASVGS